jgi:hypothetical protein
VYVARRHAGLRAEFARVLEDLSDEDVIGSPYAVTRYEVPDEMGGPAGLEVMRARLAERGLRLVLDFVPNHTARDHPLVRDRPEAFVRGTRDDLAREPESFFRSWDGVVVAHGRDPFFPAWTDTAQVDHATPAGREAMRAQLLSVAALCDGVRCDMAMLLLPDVFTRTWGARVDAARAFPGFWAEAIPAVLARHPRFLFIAEAYWGLEPRLLAEGFHFTYDKALYDHLRRRDAPAAARHLRGPRQALERAVRFLENHDEERAAEAFDGALPAALVAGLGAPGLRLVHEGQIEGRRAKLPVQLARRPDEPVDARAADLHRRLLGALAERALHDGVWEPVDVRQSGADDHTNEWVVASAWRSPWAGETRWWLLVSNLGPATAYVRIPLDASRVAPGRRYTFADRLDGASYVRDGDEMLDPGLFVALPPGEAHVLEVTPGPAGPE